MAKKTISIQELLKGISTRNCTINQALKAKNYTWSTSSNYTILVKDFGSNSRYHSYSIIHYGYDSYNRTIEKYWRPKGGSSYDYKYDTAKETGLSLDNLQKNIFYFIKKVEIPGSSDNGRTSVYGIIKEGQAFGLQFTLIGLGEELELGSGETIGVKSIEYFMSLYGDKDLSVGMENYDFSKIYIDVNDKQDEDSTISTITQDLYAIPTYTRSFSKGSSSAYTNPSNVDLSIANPFNCTLNVYHGGSLSKSLVIPVYPNEVSENNSVSFSPTSVLNRSVAYQTYSTSGRTLSFDLDLHEEIVAHNIKDKSNLDAVYNYIHYFVSVVQSAAYPNYLEHGYTDPPEISVSIGDQFYIRGILDSCSTNWKAPIIDKRLVDCSLSLGIKETTGPYTGAEVAKMMGRRL